MQRVVRDYDQEFPALAPQPKQSQHEIEKEEQEKQQRIIADKKAQEERKVEREQELAELNQEFEDIEYAEGKTLYKSIKGKLCDVNVWKRVLREVRDVNRDFHSLRAHIGIVADTIGALHFLLYPSDGAIADKPLCGRILIPRGYPKIPPVMHMSTRTNRYNVDVFNSYSKSAYLGDMQSSMCFDLLKRKNHGGTWEPEFTLSALIASLLQAIVSIKVPQMYGGEVIEYVTMEKLSSVHKNVESTYGQIKSFMPSPKVITHIEPMEVRTKYFRLPDKITSPPSNSRSLIIKSNPIFLQGPSNKMKDNVYSIGFDLSDLKNNPATVFSIILSNSPFDPVGNKPETILVRNGVTATAAKKRFDKPIEWFYHGKPMNESDLRVIVTVGYNQFCISYYVDGDRKVIHGDCPVSFLTPAEIGNVDKQSFYLSVFLKNKRGQSITVKTFIPESGCVHPVAADLH